MVIRRSSRRAPRPLPPTPALTHAATVGYLASIALGTAVQARVLDTRGYRWLHHVLYTGTAILTLAALAAGLVRRAPETALLAPAMVPLAALPHAGRRMHARVALAAAPWFAAAALSASTRSGRRR